MPQPIQIVSYTLSCAAGAGLDAIKRTLEQGETSLSQADYPQSDLQTWAGIVPGMQDHALPANLRSFDSSNNRLNDFALAQDGFTDAVSSAIRQYGASRVAVIVGSSTASMAETENAWPGIGTAGKQLSSEFARNEQTQVHTPHAPACFVAQRLGVQGPAVTVSTACSSSAKAFAMASRWLDASLVDAVVVGGSDSLSLISLYGFASLGLLSTKPCCPFDKDRDGISVGEAAGFALLTNASNALGGYECEFALAGYGESSDAHHMSHPHPQARGAISAMQQALSSSCTEPEEIGYLNLHGTATPTNDSIENFAVASVFNGHVNASSTKGWTGHTLGAAGITGSIVALEALRNGRAPGTQNLRVPDPQLACPVLSGTTTFNADKAMINTFGFGGSNCSLVFKREAL